MSKWIFICFLLVAWHRGSAQENGAPVSTALPFLSIVPDARTAAMGNAGVATEPDGYALFRNAAKYAFASDRAGIAVSYTPWMREWTKGMNLGLLNGFYRLGDRQVLALGIRCFTLGTIDLYDEEGGKAGRQSPFEWSLSLAYARHFGEHWAVGATVHFLSSDAEAGMEGAKTGHGVAFDVSGYYRNEFRCWGYPLRWSAGLAVTNMGTKISYGRESVKSFLPATLAFGGALGGDIASRQGWQFTLEARRLMVPAAEWTELEDGTAGWAPSHQSVIGGFFSSFQEDDFFRTLGWSVGAEYHYLRRVFVRAGYSGQTGDDDSQSCLTCGLGGNYRQVSLDVSWLKPTVSGFSPLENTFRISLAYTFN